MCLFAPRCTPPGSNGDTCIKKKMVLIRADLVATKSRSQTANSLNNKAFELCMVLNGLLIQVEEILRARLNLLDGSSIFKVQSRMSCLLSQHAC